VKVSFDRAGVFRLDTTPNEPAARPLLPPLSFAKHNHGRRTI
jgi:hypothetical protein